MRNYLLIFGATVSLVLGLTACLGLIFEPFEPLVGDLTRVGGYAEKDFGWTAPQPVIDIVGNSKSMLDPEILVLGDSFSRSNLWQSVVTGKSNKKIQSFEFAQVGCIRNWLAYALNHPSAKTIIIETVERSVLANFSDLPSCRSATPAPFESGPWTTSANRSTWPPEWHIYRTLQVSLNTLAMQMHGDSAIRDDTVVNAPIDRRCAKFSNRRPDRMLYFSQDEEKFEWKHDDLASAIANILPIQKAVLEQGKQFVLIVVPDKLTTYQECLSNPGNLNAGNRRDITASLIAAGVRTPDLLSIFREHVNKTVDLYLPNDTHLGVAGYVLMGEKLSHFLSEEGL